MLGTALAGLPCWSWLYTSWAPPPPLPPPPPCSTLVHWHYKVTSEFTSQLTAYITRYYQWYFLLINIECDCNYWTGWDTGWVLWATVFPRCREQSWKQHPSDYRLVSCISSYTLCFCPVTMYKNFNSINSTSLLQVLPLPTVFPVLASLRIPMELYECHCELVTECWRECRFLPHQHYQ